MTAQTLNAKIRPIAVVASKAAINEAFKPLSHALLREGRTNIKATIAGFKVVACRAYQIPGRIGPVWNPYYFVYGDVFFPSLGRNVGIRSGTRDEMVKWLHRHQRSQVQP